MREGADVIFSGAVVRYRCEGGGAEFCHATPTSILAMCGVVAFAQPFWLHVMIRRGLTGWTWILAATVMSVVVLAGLLVFGDAIAGWNLRRGRCLRCGGDLAQSGNGFYHGLVPIWWEGMVYLLAVLTPMVVDWATKG